MAMEGEANEKLLKKLAAVEVGDGGEDEPLKDRIWSETKKMWIVAAPAIFTRFSTFGIYVISQAFIGHIGSTELAAYSLVFTVLVRFANGILLGMASALETLCGQAYGAKQYHMLGVYLQRSWIVLTICSIFLVPLFIFTAPLLRALGQEDKIAEVAGDISLWLIPVLFAFVVSFTCQMFLQAQSKNMIIAYVAAFSAVVHLCLSWLLTVKYKFGILGAIASTILAYWIPNIGQLMFVLCGGCRDTWKGFSSSAFKALWPVIKLSLSSGAMLCLELWYNTVLVLLTGNMEKAEVSIDALAICLNINGWEMMISLGFLAAASIRVSNELGRGSSRSAKLSIMITVLTSFGIGFVLFVFFLFFRGRLAYIFTESDEVANAVADLSPLLAISILLNSVQPVLSGVAVGAGWQSIVAYVNIISYYLVGIPVGVALAYFFSMQVKGVWVGMLFGTFVQTIVLIVITYKTDWDKQVSLAQRRVNEWFVAEEASHKTGTGV
ncbi:protein DETOXIFICATION 21-like isoform X2 [Syzygium oleosum]|uniref:protein DETOXIFICATION 21-like isoform X2 n=1 Tax=Syzygium oleosum TaxID=219896 RepID=UPI0011D17EBF|nr:protein DETOXIFICATION 21-like isoform X2 [Syzygium oleosum]